MKKSNSPDSKKHSFRLSKISRTSSLILAPQKEKLKRIAQLTLLLRR
jgi:hypothetical protein